MIIWINEILKFCWTGLDFVGTCWIKGICPIVLEQAEK